MSIKFTSPSLSLKMLIKISLIILFLYSDDQKIWLGPRYKITSTFDESLFYVLKKTENGSRIYGETVKEGTTKVVGQFEKVITK